MNRKVTKAKILTGKVVSDKMDKSAVIMVERLIKHSTYGKYIKRSSKFHAHDEKNEAKMGDLVKIEETKPYSKTKSWKIIELLTKRTA